MPSPPPRVCRLLASLLVYPCLNKLGINSKTDDYGVETTWELWTWNWFGTMAWDNQSEVFVRSNSILSICERSVTSEKSSKKKQRQILNARKIAHTRRIE